MNPTEKDDHRQSQLVRDQEIESHQEIVEERRAEANDLLLRINASKDQARALEDDVAFLHNQLDDLMGTIHVQEDELASIRDTTSVAREELVGLQRCQAETLLDISEATKLQRSKAEVLKGIERDIERSEERYALQKSQCNALNLRINSAAEQLRLMQEQREIEEAKVSHLDGPDSTQRKGTDKSVDHAIPTLAT